MNKMILIDIETQDFPVETGIFEVACLAVEDYEIVDRLYIGHPIPGYIGPLDYGRGFYNVANDHNAIETFQQFLKEHNAPLVAHNCPFEKKFLRYYNWISDDYPLYCSMRALRYTDFDLKKYSMTYLIDYFDVTIKEQHTAMGDVLALYDLLKITQPKLWLQVGEKKR